MNYTVHIFYEHHFNILFLDFRQNDSRFQYPSSLLIKDCPANLPYPECIQGGQCNHLQVASFVIGSHLSLVTYSDAKWDLKQLHGMKSKRTVPFLQGLITWLAKRADESTSTWRETLSSQVIRIQFLINLLRNNPNAVVLHSNSHRRYHQCNCDLCDHCST